MWRQPLAAEQQQSRLCGNLRPVSASRGRPAARVGYGVQPPQHAAVGGPAAYGASHPRSPSSSPVSQRRCVASLGFSFRPPAGGSQTPAGGSGTGVYIAGSRGSGVSSSAPATGGNNTPSTPSAPSVVATSVGWHNRRQSPSPQPMPAVRPACSRYAAATPNSPSVATPTVPHPGVRTVLGGGGGRPRTLSPQQDRRPSPTPVQVVPPQQTPVRQQTQPAQRLPPRFLNRGAASVCAPSGSTARATSKVVPVKKGFSYHSPPGPPASAPILKSSASEALRATETPPGNKTAPGTISTTASLSAAAATAAAALALTRGPPDTLDSATPQRPMSSESPAPANDAGQAAVPAKHMGADALSISAASTAAESLPRILETGSSLQMPPTPRGGSGVAANGSPDVECLDAVRIGQVQAAEAKAVAALAVARGHGFVAEDPNLENTSTARRAEETTSVRTALRDCSNIIVNNNNALAAEAYKRSPPARTRILGPSPNKRVWNDVEDKDDACTPLRLSPAVNGALSPLVRLDSTTPSARPRLSTNSYRSLPTPRSMVIVHDDADLQEQEGSLVSPVASPAAPWMTPSSSTRTSPSEPRDGPVHWDEGESDESKSADASRHLEEAEARSVGGVTDAVVEDLETKSQLDALVQQPQQELLGEQCVPATGETPDRNVNADDVIDVQDVAADQAGCGEQACSGGSPLPVRKYVDRDVGVFPRHGSKVGRIVEYICSPSPSPSKKHRTPRSSPSHSIGARRLSLDEAASESAASATEIAASPSNTRAHLEATPLIDAAVYSLQNVKSNMYVTASIAANVHHGESADDPLARWRLRSVRQGVYAFQSVAVGMYLHIASDSVDKGAYVSQRADKDEWSSHWRIRAFGNGAHTVQNVNSGMYLDTGTRGPAQRGSRVLQWDNPYELSAHWKLELQDLGEQSACTSHGHAETGVEEECTKDTDVANEMELTEEEEALEEEMEDEEPVNIWHGEVQALLPRLQNEDLETRRLDNDGRFPWQLPIYVPEGVGEDRRVRVVVQNMELEAQVPDGVSPGMAVLAELPLEFPMPPRMQEKILQSQILHYRLRYEYRKDVDKYITDPGREGSKKAAFRRLRGRCMAPRLPAVQEDVPW